MFQQESRAMYRFKNLIGLRANLQESLVYPSHRVPSIFSAISRKVNSTLFTERSSENKKFLRKCRRSNRIGNSVLQLNSSMSFEKREVDDRPQSRFDYIFQYISTDSIGYKFSTTSVIKVYFSLLEPVVTTRHALVLN